MATTGETTVAESTLTDERVIVGTPSYLAPELFAGEEATPPTDIWALGVLLYRMCCGQSPFKRGTMFELSAAVLREDHRPLPSSVPAALSAVVDRCLQKSKRRRYQQAREVEAALESVGRQIAVTGPELLPPSEFDTTVDVPVTPGQRSRSAADAESPATDPETLVHLTRLLETLRTTARTVWTLLILFGILGFLGFLTSIAFDLALHVPSRTSPVGYIATGGRALFPAAVWMVVDVSLIVAGIRIVKALRFVLSMAQRGRTLVRGLEHTLDSFRAIVTGYDPVGRATLYIVIAVAGVSGLVALSWPLLSTITQLIESPVGFVIDTSILGSSHETYLNVCLWSGATVTLTLIVGWFGTFRPFTRHPGASPSLSLYRAVGLGVVVLAAAVTTAPWRLLWNNQSEPVTYEGTRDFVVGEDVDRLYLWVAEPPGGRAVGVPSDDPGLDRSVVWEQQRIFDPVELE